MGGERRKKKKSSGGSCGRDQTQVRGSITPFDEKTLGLLGCFGSRFSAHERRETHSIDIRNTARMPLHPMDVQ